jgi:hypothetical protein
MPRTASSAPSSRPARRVVDALLLAGLLAAPFAGLLALLSAPGCAQSSPPLPDSPQAATTRTPPPPPEPTGAAPALAAPDTLLVNGLLNGGFEWVADGTTDPPKYGAYWLGAFSRQPEDAACFVVEDRPYRGRWALRLSRATGEVLQKIVADPRWTDELVVSMALRSSRGGVLALTIEDGPGRRTTVRVHADDETLELRATDDAPLQPRALRREQDGWWRVEVPLGALFTAEHGARPMPRLNLRLHCEGVGRPLVDLDELAAAVRLPAPGEAELADAITELLRWTLDTWALPREQGGLGLVDEATGYVTAGTYHVESGEPGAREHLANLHTLHNLLVLWLREAERRGWDAELGRWTPLLERFARTLLERHFDPTSGLPRLVVNADGTPSDAAVPVASFVEFLLDAHELVADPELAEACLAQARRVADALVALQAEHDIPPERAPPTPVWNPNAGRITGDLSNWFGFLPDRLTPQGEPETDRRFYTSWAILTGRTFWYEFLRSPRAIAAVHARRPAPGDLVAVNRTLERFHRDWDATRYDLENDTDDHYGYLVEDALDIAEHVPALAPAALALVGRATDHRLAPDAGSAGDTLWIQALRLGTACAGDSPRAFLGPLRLSELPPEDEPSGARPELYHEALLELAANDFKGRQLTNAQFTESFFGAWEMVCICFRGTYQGDCREQPPEFWHGDVGDTFGGPPTTAIDAQTAALRVAGPAERPVILARLGLIRHVTDSTLRGRHGYRSGLDEAVARQYELPDKYVIGVSEESAAGLAYAMAWMRLLPHLGGPDRPQDLRLTAQREGDATHVLLRGPPGALVALPTAAIPIAAPVSDRDPRMLALDLADLPGGLGAVPRLLLGPDGTASVPRDELPADAALVQPLHVDKDGAILSIGPAAALD